MEMWGERDDGREAGLRESVQRERESAEERERGRREREGGEGVKGRADEGDTEGHDVMLVMRFSPLFYAPPLEGVGWRGVGGKERGVSGGRLTRICTS